MKTLFLPPKLENFDDDDDFFTNCVTIVVEFQRKDIMVILHSTTHVFLTSLKRNVMYKGD